MIPSNLSSVSFPFKASQCYLWILLNMKFSQKIGHLFEEFRTLKRVDVREHILKKPHGAGVGHFHDKKKLRDVLKLLLESWFPIW
jgi:hypothetical protein